MARFKMTQRMAAFYILMKAYRETPGEFIPAWKFVGELEIPEIGEHFLMSYKTPTNGLTIFDDFNWHKNPMIGFVERKMLHGKSGANYYGYRLNNPDRKKITDPKLLDFYDRVKEGQRRFALKPIIPEHQS